MKLLPALLAAASAKECIFHNWSSWTECSWLCGPDGTKERSRKIKLPRKGDCTENGEKPVLREVISCNRKCLNGGVMTNTNDCRCKPSFMGRCCEIPKTASVDRCDKLLRAPDNGSFKCGRSKAVPNALAEGSPKVNGREPLPFSWECSAKCAKGKGMYRATEDIVQCKAEGWQGQSFQQRSFAFEDYDDTTPTLPLPDCADRKTILGVSTSFQLEYSALASGVPAALASIVDEECNKKTNKARAGLSFESTFTITDGSLGRRGRREGEADVAEADVAEADPAAPEEEATTTAAPEPSSFIINADFKVAGKATSKFGWTNQDTSKTLLRDCVGSVLSSFEASVGVADAEGFTAVAKQNPEDMDMEQWPRWDFEGAGCLPGSIPVGGSVQEKLECQACPRGTVFVSRERGTRTACRPCPAGTWMDKEGATHNNAGEAGECNACPSHAHMTNVFPAYTQDQCAKSSCFPNRTKFQVVFALDSSGSVTKPDYIRMREFAKTIVSRMCIDNGGDDSRKSCGNAGYVIYNSSPESYMKFKQVENFDDFSKIDNYEYRGGPAAIGDLFDFIQRTFVESENLKTGIPLNVVLISDGQTTGDDKENMAKWTTILKKKVTKIITISKRSMFNSNTLQLATSMDDRYFLYDYHELPGLVFPVMEQLCESVNVHKENLKRKSLERRSRRRQKAAKGK